MSLSWIVCGLALCVSGSIGSARGCVRSGRWLLLGCVGVGLCCIFMGILSLRRPPLGDLFWMRLLWSTSVLVVPSWVAFSYRFGRAHAVLSNTQEIVVLVLLSVAALVLLVLGRLSEPVRAVRMESGDVHLVLQMPGGRWVGLHAIAGVVLVMRNLHGTLRAAQVEGPRRLVRAIYALFPLALAGSYVFGQALIYNQISIELSTLLLVALFLSTIGFALALGHRGLDDVDLPADARLQRSSGVMTAIGLFLVALGILSALVRHNAEPGITPWYEAPVIAILASALTFRVFPGFRSEIGGFLLSRVGTSGSSDRRAVERLDAALAGVRTWEQVLEPLRTLVQEFFGPVQLQLWSLQRETGDMVPVGHTNAPTLPKRHPLTMTLQERTRPLPVAGDAIRLVEIPLHVGAREVQEHLGIRVFFPIVSRKRLVGVLGCGPGGGRTLHPEDLDLLQALADRLGGLLTQQGVLSLDAQAGRAGGEGPPA